MVVKAKDKSYFLPRISFLIIEKGTIGISPFVFRKLALLRDNFSFDELKKFFFTLFEVDYKIKTGKILPEQALFDLISLV